MRPEPVEGPDVGLRQAQPAMKHRPRRLRLIAPLAFARSARIAPSSSPTSSSLADDKACLLAPPQHGEGAIRFEARVVLAEDC